MLVKGPPVAQASTRTAVQALTARLAHVPRVTGVVNTYTSPDPQLRSHDGRTSLMALTCVSLRKDAGMMGQTMAIAAMRADARAVPG